MDPLTDREAEILRFERQRWRSGAAKDQVVADLFDLAPLRYAQTVNALIGRPEALVAEPVVVRRLLRLRSRGAASAPAPVDPRQQRRARRVPAVPAPLPGR